MNTARRTQIEWDAYADEHHAGQQGAFLAGVSAAQAEHLVYQEGVGTTSGSVEPGPREGDAQTDALPLDPEPWLSHSRLLGFRTATEWGRCSFRPRPEYEQDRTKYDTTSGETNR